MHLSWSLADGPDRAGRDADPLSFLLLLSSAADEDDQGQHEQQQQQTQQQAHGNEAGQHQDEVQRDSSGKKIIDLTKSSNRVSCCCSCVHMAVGHELSDVAVFEIACSVDTSRSVRYHCGAMPVSSHASW
jgi:hypothetical protein